MAQSAKQSNMTDKLAKLKDKLANTNMGGSGNAGFWSPPAGSSMIRILPEVGDMPFFFQEVGQHRLPDNTMIKCPAVTTDGEHNCPICDLVSELYRGGDKDKELAGQLKARKAFWMNIVVRDKANDTGGNTHEGPYIYTPGVTVFKELANLINIPDYGDITNEETGTDIYIMKEGEKLDTKYTITARRNSTPLAAEDVMIDELLDKAVDLSWVMLSEDPEEDATIGDGYTIRLLPYDRLVDEYGLAPGMSARDVSATLASRPKSGGQAVTPASTKELLNRRATASTAAKAKDPVDDVDEEFAAAAATRRTRRTTR